MTAKRNKNHAKRNTISKRNTNVTDKNTSSDTVHGVFSGFCYVVTFETCFLAV
jgi:hypothetical protein